MLKRKYKSLILIAIVVTFVIASLFAVNALNFDEANNNAQNINFASRPSSVFLDQYYANCDGIISDLGIGEWDIYTAYPEFYSVSKVNYNEESCIYFDRYASDDKYSSTASLTTPELSLNSTHNVYSLSFDYFSLATRALANNILVYASNDGEKYEKIGGVDRVFNDNEDNFINVSFDITNEVRFLRFDLKIYNSVSTGYGIYLKNFQLSPKTLRDEPLPSFTVERDDTNPLLYTGNKQLPSYTVSCSVPDYEYNIQEIVLNSSYRLKESIEIGSYTLIILIYNVDNVIVDINELQFSITKGNIARAEVDYFATEDGVNINHVSLYNSSGDIINNKVGAISYTQPFSRPYSTSISVTTSMHFEEFEQTIALNTNSNYLLNIGNPIQTYIYDGTAKTVTFENLSGKQSVVRYYKHNTLLDQAPKDAGSYSANIYIEDQLVKTIALIIKPKEITAINNNGAISNRAYDGTTNVYDAAATSFIFKSGAEEINDTSLTLDNLKFACSTGYTYVVFDKATFGGNYILQEGATVERTYATIEKINLKLINNIDQDNNTILTIGDKQYDGLNIASINTSDIIARYNSLKSAPLEFLGVPKDDSFSLESIEATFDSVFAGDAVPVSLTIVDLTCFDRFNVDIYTPQGLVFGRIVPKKLDIDLDLSNIQVVSKKYDATLSANVDIISVVFNSGVVAADQAIMSDNANFELQYTLAEYANANAGIKEVDVTGFILCSKNPIYSEVINSYTVNDITLFGEILQVEVTVQDEFFHVLTGQSIPLIKTNPADIDLYVSYYYSKEAAQNGQDEIGDFNTESYMGVFYIRVEIAFNEDNYQLAEDYAIIVIQITGEKKAQSLTFNIDNLFEHDDGDGIYYVMAIGGRFSPNAVSQSKVGVTDYLTGLPLTYERNTGTKMTYAQGVYTAREEGLVSITVRQNGNSVYLAATPVTINILIVDSLILANNDISYADALYYGDEIPQVSGSALFDDEEINGTYTRKSGTLSAGLHNYLYNFVPSEKYLGEYNDINVPLTAEKAVLEVDISDITMDYHSEIDIKDYARITLVKGTRELQLNTSEFSATNISFVMHSELQLNQWQHKETAYVVGFNDSYANYIEVLNNTNYEIIVQNETVNIFVNRAEITIEAIDFSKDYGFAEYEIVYDIKGNFDTADTELILQAAQIVEQAKTNSTVGRYVLLLSLGSIDESLSNKYSIKTVNGFMDIARAKIDISANNATSIYGQPLSPLSYTITGFHIANDGDYYSEYITLTHSVTEDSDVGDYDILSASLPYSDNYKFIFIKGIYTVSPATLNGITLQDANFLYDGLRHSLEISYDKNVWGELAVAYNNYDIVDIGRYPITATVTKNNYYDLILDAVLTVSSLSVSASNNKMSATVTMLGDNLTGFDPRATLMLLQNNNVDTINAYNSALINNEDTKENILGIYNYFLLVDSNRQEINGNAEVKIKLDGVNINTKIRVLAIIDGEFFELQHDYKNGYVVFESNGVTEFAIVKSVSAYAKDTSSLIIGIGVAAGIIIVFYLIFIGYRKTAKKSIKRSIRKHNRWA